MSAPGPSPLRDFLANPFGWAALIIAEVALLFAVGRVLASALAGTSDGLRLGAFLAIALAITVGNYLVRRRYLSGR
jgi:hypothetical protein